MIVLGIDVGGSSIKAAPVDVATGEVLGASESVPTPDPATPAAVAEALRVLAARFPIGGPVGVAFPAVVKEGVVHTAANIDRSWIGTDGKTLIEKALGRPVAFLNDADAAGIAEMEWGTGQGCTGTVLLLTFGTGIGSALFAAGQLVPNTELGHLRMGAQEAEEYASGRARAQEQLDWKAWAGRVNEVLDAYHRLLWPDVFIIGGGVTESYESFRALLKSPAEIRPARFRAQAGIVGAALDASRLRL